MTEERMGECQADESVPVKIARYTVETFVATGKIPEVEEVQAFGSGTAGCFVSLHSRKGLRGCIGTIAPTMDSVTAEIIRNAVCACSEDPRFDPVRLDELADLVYSVDILEPSEPVESLDALDPKVYGVIVTSGFRRGLLLPDLEGVDSVAAQLAIACRKAGIASDESYDIRRFRVTRYR